MTESATAIEFDTRRLRLRQWRDADRAPFAAMCADPRVMEFLPAPLDRAASDAWVDRLHERIERQGWGQWAVELVKSGRFIGLIGLRAYADEFPFAPCVEIGWRLAPDFWGRGYASEGARACCALGFRLLDLDEIVSFTALPNQRSRAVMERLGMRLAPGTFPHPSMAADSPLREHCLYRLTRADWSASMSEG
jgi:RimJ/RimL family protein N-acetyltransferase